MKIAVVGTGYVGLVLGACLAENGNSVVCVDKDESKIDTLKSGRMPIYEPGLEEIVRRNEHEERLAFTTDLPSAVRASEIAFIAVGTPQGAEEGAGAGVERVDAAGDHHLERLRTALTGRGIASEAVLVPDGESLRGVVVYTLPDGRHWTHRFGPGGRVLDDDALREALVAAGLGLERIFGPTRRWCLARPL